MVWTLLVHTLLLEFSKTKTAYILHIEKMRNLYYNYIVTVIIIIVRDIRKLKTSFQPKRIVLILKHITRKKEVTRTLIMIKKLFRFVLQKITLFT